MQFFKQTSHKPLLTLSSANITKSVFSISQISYRLITIQNSITFLQSAHEGDTLIAEATETFNHHRLPFCEIRVTNQNGDLLCVVTGSAYRTKKEWR